MAERDRALADNARLTKALSDLVAAKNAKDAHGDTPDYRRLKEGAWEQARQALEAVTNTPTFGSSEGRES